MEWPASTKCGTGCREGFVPGYRDRGDPKVPGSNCNYCGSMRPEEVLEALLNGAKLDMADWKYGWPHKFYVNEISHENEDAQVSRCSSQVDGETVMGEWVGGEFVAGATTRVGKGWGKFYTIHMEDIEDPIAFAALAAALNEAHPQVSFEMTEDGRVKWRGSSPRY